jgi:hypothetical protein
MTSLIEPLPPLASLRWYCETGCRSIHQKVEKCRSGVGNLCVRVFGIPRHDLGSRANPQVAWATSLKSCSKNANPKVVQVMLRNAIIPQTMDVHSQVLPNVQDEAPTTMESALT